MKILVLPFNVASLSAVMVESFNKINGVEAKGLFIGKHKSQYVGQNSIYVDVNLPNQTLNNVVNRIIVFFIFIRLIFWADSVYYMWNSILPFALDLKIVKLLKKNALIEWCGSEIRNPVIVKKNNPYLTKVYENLYEYAKLETEANSLSMQRKFKSHNFRAIASHEVGIYINRTLFVDIYTIFQRIQLSKFKLVQVVNQKPLIIHAPTAPIAKGSNIIIPIIAELQKEYDFDFKLIQGYERQEVLNLMQKCDVFIDQIVIGSYGLASCEAMAMGKPTVCYIMPAVFEASLPKDCPIVNANPDTLKATLIELITNVSLRKEIGVKSREYIEKYHDADKIAVDVYNIFKEIALLKK